MTIASVVAAETGLDLGNPKLAAETFAPAIALRFQSVVPQFDNAVDVAKKILTAYKGLTAATTVASAIGAAVAAVGTALDLLEGAASKAVANNLAGRIRAKNDAVKEIYRPGDWSTVYRAMGPEPSALKIKGGVGQYAPGIVWTFDKVGKGVLVPTWSTPFYDDKGIAPSVWVDGYAFPYRSPLSGFGYGSGIVPRAFFDHQPPVSPIPEKYADNYWGSSRYLIDLHCDEAGFGKRFKCLQSMMDSSVYEKGFAPPPDYTYLFSWGTYPYLSWSTASNGVPQRPFNDSSAAGAALYAAIHSLTPLHAAISSKEVEQCYRNWLEATQLRRLPRLTAGQKDSGVYLDSDGLPWSPDNAATIYTFQPGVAGANNKPWSTKNPGGCGDGSKDSFSGCYRPEGWGFAYSLPWQVAREIEEAFRSFFRIRRAALFQMELASASFREAAAVSADPVLAAAAKGKKPAYKAWNVADPLGDGWFKAGTLLVPHGTLGTPPSAGGGGGIVIGGLLALGVGYLLLR